MSEDRDGPIPNPCIRHCCLDQDDICLGCYRSLDEILRWSQSTNEQRHEILRACTQRKVERKGRWT
ncbi:DUF1289 domain-containing protein [Vibrio sp. VPAP30]|uniref:DUF1289 domain-containing protein n=1 Tax=Vibrio sp. VPAP30 TaxID=1647102 RepID=UPI0009E559E1|nr:DUF1289 domain-containing protein [Vibrio sp. VPAP30]